MSEEENKEDSEKLKPIDLTSFKPPEPTDEPASEEHIKKVANMIPPDVLEWILGKSEAPQEIRTMGDDIAKKMNWYTALTILQQYERLPKMFAFLHAAEGRLLDEGAVKDMDITKLLERHMVMSKGVDNIMEFSRKFLYSNAAALTGTEMNEQDRKLVDLIRQLKPEQVEGIIDTIEKEMTLNDGPTDSPE